MEQYREGNMEKIRRAINDSVVGWCFPDIVSVVGIAFFLSCCLFSVHFFCS